jgi:hypothetical protein
MANGIESTVRQGAQLETAAQIFEQQYEASSLLTRQPTTCVHGKYVILYHHEAMARDEAS